MRRVVLLTAALVFIVGTCIPLTARAADPDIKKPAKEDYELQERCSKRAEEFFRQQWGDGATEDGLAVYAWSYNNHYNRKLNKCLFLLVGRGYYKDKRDAPSYTEELRDVNEKKEYGHFTQFRLRAIDEPTPPPICDIDLLKKHCGSKEEWDAFVKPYMEE